MTVSKAGEMKFVLWNARGWSNKKVELKEIIKDYDVVMITETWAKEGGKI